MVRKLIIGEFPYADKLNVFLDTKLTKSGDVLTGLIELGTPGATDPVGHWGGEMASFGMGHSGSADHGAP